MVEALGVLERRFEAAVGCENGQRMELTGEGPSRRWRLLWTKLRRGEGLR
jgi:hypothetical protein